LSRQQRLAGFARFYSNRLQVQAREAPQRVADFQVSIDGEYLCPRCWVYDGQKLFLKQVASDSPKTESFECERRHTFTIPIDADESAPRAP
jgi:hypothetical protein